MDRRLVVKWVISFLIFIALLILILFIMIFQIKGIKIYGWFVFFLIGTLAAFIMEFIRFLRQNKTLTEIVIIGKSKINTTNFNKFAIFISIIYVIIGGVIAGIFATTKNEAFLYGGLWQVLFTYTIRLNDRV